MSTCKFWGVLCLTLLTSSLSAQTETPERKATISTRAQADGLQFIAQVPDLIQVPGAPPAYWLYHWEFGDGCFSNEESPVHAYENVGSYPARLALTAVYDDGDDLPPAKKQTGVTAVASAHQDLPDINWVADDKSLRLDNFQLPIPGQSMDLVFTYRNDGENIENGRLLLFFNERHHEARLFVVDEVRLHHDEVSVDPTKDPLSAHFLSRDTWAGPEGAPPADQASSLYFPEVREPEVDAARAYYSEYREWLFTDIEPNEERHFFVTFDCTEDMLVDTNEMISMQAIYLAENGRKDTTKLKMPIRDSHDPNLITVNENKESFRGFKNNKLTYRVQFQNEGDREAREVIIECTLPQGMEAESVEILETDPVLPRCADVAPGLGCLRDTIIDNKIKFTFDGIYLAGTKQPGVADKDSTIGFIEYRVKATKKVQKKKLVSRADIIFDNNEVIQTNFATTRFKTGWSLGFRVGREIPGVDCAAGGYFGGISYSAYQPYNWYWQPELLYFSGDMQEQLLELGSDFDVPGPNPEAFYNTDTTQVMTSSCFRFDVVPLQFRKNLTSWIGIGTGLQFSIERCKEVFEPAMVTFTNLQDPDDVVTQTVNDFTIGGFDSDIHSALFLDVNLGSARIGPSLGARYVYDFKAYDCAAPEVSNFKKKSRLQLYFIWRI